MTVYIGNAVGNENGTANGGEPGNQNGKELRIQPWYLSDKGWRVFRPFDKETAENLVYDMKAACENENIGYSQKNRNTLYKLVEPYGFDCGDADEPCECDCSSLVRVCLAFAGIEVNDFNTSTEPKRLLDTGEFEEMVGEEYTDSPNKLKLGDILVTRTKGHTAIVMNDGSDPEPPDPPVPPEPPTPTKQMVVVIGNSVYVRETDEKNAKGKPVGKIMFTAHKRNRFNLIDISADTGWYHIETYKGPGYISNRADLTCLVTISQ